MTEDGALEKEHVLSLLKDMLRVRRFEEKCVELYTRQKIRGFLHLYIGQEAVGTGLMRSVAPEDALVTTYREHALALLRGIPMNAVMAEMFGNMEGCSGGRGGSMHLFDKQSHFIGGNAIVGAGLPLAIGLGLAARLRNQNRLAWCVFGEGAMAEGEFHESLNLATLWELPVVFACENNYYAMGTALARSQSETDLTVRARSYGMAVESVDGMDVLACETAARRAADWARTGKGPYFLEFRTYRFRAHSMFDPERYRDKAEVLDWKARGPILRFSERLEREGLLDDSIKSTMEADIQREIDDAVDYAEAGHPEPVETLYRFVYSEANQSHSPERL